MNELELRKFDDGRILGLGQYETPSGMIYQACLNIYPYQTRTISKDTFEEWRIKFCHPGQFDPETNFTYFPPKHYSEYE